jgi:hypothetical protein
MHDCVVERHQLYASEPCVISELTNLKNNNKVYSTTRMILGLRLARISGLRELFKQLEGLLSANRIRSTTPMVSAHGVRTAACSLQSLSSQ